jgi:C4-dicarboxylate-specific signal transduction histidine kinase
MQRVWAQPLRQQLFLALVFLLAPMLLAAAGLGYVEYRETVEELSEQTQATAMRSAAAIERELMGLDRMARNLSNNAVFQRLDAAGVEPLLRTQRLQRPSLLEIVLVDNAGQVIGHGTGEEKFPSGWTELMSPVVHKGMRVVTPLQKTQSGTPYITVAYPVAETSGAIVGAVLCHLNPQLMVSTFEQLMLPEGSVVTLMEPDGRVIARNLEPERYIGQVLNAGWTADAPEPPQQLDGPDGVRRLYSEAVVASGPWLVSVGIPMSVAYQRAFSLWTRSSTILALGLSGWLVVVLVFSRRLTRSVAHLEGAAQRIASGDFSPVEPQRMPTREFEQLQLAFGHMLRRFNETRTALDAQMAEQRRMLEELQSLQRQVIRQERLAAVGQLVSGVAHEINNPLQAILGFAELLQMQANVPDEVKNDLILIQKESARACGIIRNLALFARQQTGEATRVRHGDVIASVAELRQRRLESEDIELRVEDASKQHVLAVMTELQQVVLNFVVNAEQAIVMSGRRPGRITLRTRDEGDRVILEVEDTGPGVPHDNEAKLFQPFFTTKPVGSGTGLGLSVSYGIIDSLGGHIGYRRAPAGGAIFYFDLPAASENR